MEGAILVWQEPVTFEDIAVYLSRAEWDAIAVEQKGLYCSVMLDNYKLLTSLGKPAILMPGLGCWPKGGTAGAGELPSYLTLSEPCCFQRLAGLTSVF